MSLLLILRPRGAGAGAIKSGAVAFPIVMGATVAARRIRTRAVAVPITMDATASARRIRTRAVSVPITMGHTVTAQRIRSRAVAVPIVMTSTVAGRRIRSRAMSAPIVMDVQAAGEVRSAIQSGTVTFPLQLAFTVTGQKVGGTPPIVPGEGALGSGGGGGYGALPVARARRPKVRTRQVAFHARMQWQTRAARVRSRGMSAGITMHTSARALAEVPALAEVAMLAMELFDDSIDYTTGD